MALWSSWTWGQKKHMGFLKSKFPIKMTMISYSDSNFKSSLLKMSELFLKIIVLIFS
jgi:hypothetical protein